MILITSAPVLIVDDSTIMIQILQNMLDRIGFVEIDTADSGHEALKSVWKKDYGLIISDWNMTPVSGYELLTKIRAMPSVRDVPFIMITAGARQSRVMAARAAGATSFLVKPFNLETLELKIIECTALV